MPDKQNKLASESYSLEFEKSRLEYCKELYQREGETKTTIEKKAEFSLSFVTLFLGAIFLKLDFILTIKQILPLNTPWLMWILYILLFSLLLSLTVSLIAIWQSMKLISYKDPYPNNLYVAMFSPDSEYSASGSSKDFIRSCAMTYTAAVVANNTLNQKKAKWVEISFSSTLFALLPLVTLIIIVGYFLLK